MSYPPSAASSDSDYQQTMDQQQNDSMETGSNPFKHTAPKRVYCFHGNLLYEARLLKVDWKEPRECIDSKSMPKEDLKKFDEKYKNVDKVPAYYIHYHGWNKNWDEWVLEERIEEFNDANKEKFQKLGLLHTNKRAATNKPQQTPITVKSHNESLTKTKDVSLEKSSRRPGASGNEDKTSTPVTPGAASSIGSQSVSASKTRRRRLQRQPYASSKEYTIIHDEVKIALSDKLKQLLVDDYFYCQKEKKIVKLPCNVTVNSLIEDYMEDREKNIDQLTFPARFNADPDSKMQNFRKSCLQEFTKGLQTYFNCVLGTQLLYQIEYIQFNDQFGLDSTNNENSQLAINSEDNSETESTSKPIRSHHHSKHTKSSTSVETEKPNQQEPSQIYPAIHLLRMLAKMDTFLQYYNCDKTVLGILEVLIEDFLSFIENHSDRYFGQSIVQYIDCGTDYLQRSLIAQNTMAIDDDNSNQGSGLVCGKGGK